MLEIHPETRLADLVTRHPPVAGELERLGLDFCRSGGSRLSEACASRGLDVAPVLRGLRERALDADTDPPAWSRMGAAQLVDHIEATHHRYLWDELPRLTALVEQVVAAAAAEHPVLHGVAATFAELRHELEPHLQREEMELFPFVRELATDGSVAESSHRSGIVEMLDEMVGDHDRTGVLIVTLRQLTDSFRPPADGCVSHWTLYDLLARLAADTRLHVHIENNLLVPAVASMERRHAACR